MRADLRAVELTLSGGFTGNYLEDEPSGYVSLANIKNHNHKLVRLHRHSVRHMYAREMAAKITADLDTLSCIDGADRGA